MELRAIRITHTDAYQNHKDCSYAYKEVCCYDHQYSKPLKLYRGPDAVYKFIDKMLEEEKWCIGILKEHFNKTLEITAAEEKKFSSADSCHICGIKYNSSDVRVRDHCHITGKYRRSALSLVNTDFPRKYRRSNSNRYESFFMKT